MVSIPASAGSLRTIAAWSPVHREHPLRLPANRWTIAKGRLGALRGLVAAGGEQGLKRPRQGFHSRLIRGQAASSAQGLFTPPS